MDFLTAIRRESDLFYATAGGADAARAVPSCPGWTIEDLVWHLGEVHWFWGTVVEMRATDPAAVEAAKPDRPATYPALVAWAQAQAARMISLLEAADDAVPVWTWSPPHQTVGFIRRHQVQEAAVHRWDIQRAASDAPPEPVEAQAASDAIDELLAVTLPWGVSDTKPLAGSVHLHCTDTEGEWFIHPDGTVEPIHAKGDVALRGTASNLLLATFKRVEFTALDVIGDEALGRAFVERINTE